MWPTQLFFCICALLGYLIQSIPIHAFTQFLVQNNLRTLDLPPCKSETSRPACCWSEIPLSFRPALPCKDLLRPPLLPLVQPLLGILRLSLKLDFFGSGNTGHQIPPSFAWFFFAQFPGSLTHQSSKPGFFPPSCIPCAPIMDHSPKALVTWVSPRC